MSLCSASVSLLYPCVTHGRVVKVRIGRRRSGLKCCPGGNMYYNNSCMDPTRFVRSTCALLCLCLLGLSACGTASTPLKGNTSQASSCGMAGKTHTIRAASSTPLVQGAWPMSRGDLDRDGAATTGGGSMLTLAWSYCTGAAVLS